MYKNGFSETGLRQHAIIALTPETIDRCVATSDIARSRIAYTLQQLKHMIVRNHMPMIVSSPSSNMSPVSSSPFLCPLSRRHHACPVLQTPCPRPLQIMINYRNGHTGQLASVTTILNFVGASIRILTTIQEVRASASFHQHVEELRVWLLQHTSPS